MEHCAKATLTKPQAECGLLMQRYNTCKKQQRDKERNTRRWGTKRGNTSDLKFCLAFAVCMALLHKAEMSALPPSPAAQHGPEQAFCLSLFMLTRRAGQC